MSGYLFETDLVPQKYRIIVAPRQDRIIRALALELDMPLQELRACLIDHLDMIQLENLPARAEMAEKESVQEDALWTALGREKYTTFLQIVSRDEMDRIYTQTAEKILSGMPFEDAVAYGRACIRGALER